MTRSHDPGEGGADDHADGKIDDVSPQREFFEFGKHVGQPRLCNLPGRITRPGPR
jgi:hypothetical protein